MSKRRLSNKIAIVAVVVLVFSGAFVLAGPGDLYNLIESYRVDNNDEKMVKMSVIDGDECKKVINQSQNDYFVPTKTWSEWIGFRDKASSGNLDGVSLGGCYFSAPSGAISFFSSSDLTYNNGCPDEWARLSQAEGMYLVNTPEDGNTNEYTGLSLGNREDRPSGTHKHELDDPEHFHAYHYNSGGGDRYGGGNSTNNADVLLQTSSDKIGIPGDETGAVTTIGGISVEEGTPAPYIQYVVCQKI